MSKMTDLLKQALARKNGTHHMENDEAPVVEKKAGKQRAPVVGKKPPTRSAGRGRWALNKSATPEGSDVGIQTDAWHINVFTVVLLQNAVRK